MSPGARERLITSAITLFRHKGIAGTGVAELLEHSGAGRGSIYTHFPGGKAQLAAEATRAAGQEMTGLLATLTAAHDPITALAVFTGYWRDLLRDGDFRYGCPILPAAIQDDQSLAARGAAGDAFRQWRDLLAETLRRHGVPADRASSVATLAVTSMEGAVVVARAQRSLEPLDHVEAELTRLARDLIPA